MVKGRIVFIDTELPDLHFEASYTKLRDGWFCIHYGKKPEEKTYRQEFWPAHMIETVYQDSDQASEKRMEAKIEDRKH